MYISSKDWKNYIDKLSALDKKAGELMQEWIQKHGFSDTKALIDYAYAVATKYGEGSAALAAAMYDAIAEMSGKMYQAAEVAATPAYGEVAKTVNGILKHSQNPNSISNAISRLVKRTGADTMLKNAERDGAQFAWVPNGDTCAFCITLASRGWQYMSKKALKNGHAEHIHANCDCTYAIRFDNKSGVRGYDPQKYEDMYYGADGNTPNERINSLRRMRYAERKDVINAQKREAYAETNVVKERVRSVDYPPDYERNRYIDEAVSSKQIVEMFPEIDFQDSFMTLDLAAQKEIAQGFAHMKDTFGARALPTSCKASRMIDYGKTKIKSGVVTFQKGIGTKNGFSTACHECIHVYDGKSGLISEKILAEVKRTLGYSTRKQKNAFDRQMLDLLGYQYYNTYKDDPLEILAYAYEEWLYGSDNALVQELVGSLLRRRL